MFADKYAISANKGLACVVGLSGGEEGHEEGVGHEVREQAVVSEAVRHQEHLRRSRAFEKHRSSFRCQIMLHLPGKSTSTFP